MKKFILLLTPIFFLTACGEKEKKITKEKNPYYQEITVRKPIKNPNRNTDPFADIDEDKNQEEENKDNTSKNIPKKIKPVINLKDKTKKNPNTPKKISFFEVQKHNTESDCWFIIGKEVFDVTKWIPIHPGGPLKILKNCGKNATKDFEGQHGGSAQIAKKAQSFKIGDLK